MDGSENHRKKPIFLLSAIAIVLAAVSLIGYIVYRGSPFDASSASRLKIKDTEIKIEVANSDEERRLGLCCRDSLAKDSGMLFIYDQPGDYHFWMKDTRIPLDMYWISNDKKIIHIERNVQPSTFPKTFGTDTPAQYVLETNAGFADKHSIDIGDRVSF